MVSLIGALYFLTQNTNCQDVISYFLKDSDGEMFILKNHRISCHYYCQCVN